jgi:hypothetical protein
VIRAFDLVRFTFPGDLTKHILGSRDEHGRLHLETLHAPECPAWKVSAARCWCAQVVYVAGKGVHIDLEGLLERLRDVEEAGR